MAFNTNITVAGNLTRDPKLVGEGSKTRVLLGIAVNEPRRDAEDKTSFFNATAFGEYLAKNVAKSLSKGDRVLIKGSLESYGREVSIDGDDVTLQIANIVVDEIGADLRFATVDISRQGKKATSAASPEEDEEDEAEEKPKARRSTKAKSKSKAKPVEDEDDLF